MDKLVKEVDLLWETKSVYREQRPEKELQEVKKALLRFTFKFSLMYWSWIPKPNKLGELRAITKPDKADILVMDALSHLLNIVFGRLSKGKVLTFPPSFRCQLEVAFGSVADLTFRFRHNKACTVFG